MAFSARRFASLADLPAAFDAVLLEDEMPNSGALSLLAGLRKHGTEPTRLYGVYKDEQPYGLAFQTHADRFLVLSWMGEKALPALIEEILRDPEVLLPGAWGSEPTAGIFAGLWSVRTNIMARLSMPQGLYKLTELATPAPTGGSHRAATPEDIDLASNWYSDFTRDAGLEAKERLTPEQARKPVETMVSGGRLYFWCATLEDGVTRPVAMAAKTRETPNGTCVTLVYTPRELRGRGFAGAVTWHLSREILATGRFAFLHTDLRNPTSNALYRKLGYRFVNDHASYFFGKDAPGV